MSMLVCAIISLVATLAVGGYGFSGNTSAMGACRMVAIGLAMNTLLFFLAHFDSKRAEAK